MVASPKRRFVRFAGGAAPCFAAMRASSCSRATSTARAKPVAAAALARGVAEPQRADFSRARAGPSLCRPAACCRAPIGAPQPQLILFLLLSDMLELHACSIAAKPCEPRLHERLLSSADISLKRVDGLFEPLDNNDVSTVKDLARLAAATTIQCQVEYMDMGDGAYELVGLRVGCARLVSRLGYSGGTCWRRRAGSDSVAGV